MENTSAVSALLQAAGEVTARSASIETVQTVTAPAFYRGEFVVTSDPLHSYLDVRGWGHGIALINGFNLGRFSADGPASTLFVPKGTMKPGKNELLVFESQRGNQTGTRQMELIDHMVWAMTGPPPSN